VFWLFWSGFNHFSPQELGNARPNRPEIDHMGDGVKFYTISGKGGKRAGEATISVATMALDKYFGSVRFAYQNLPS
jgi:hypothetical protein